MVLQATQAHDIYRYRVRDCPSYDLEALKGWWTLGPLSRKRSLAPSPAALVSGPVRWSSGPLLVLAGWLFFFLLLLAVWASSCLADAVARVAAA